MKWIKVGKRKPKDMQWCIVIGGSFRPLLGQWDEKRNGWSAIDGHSCVVNQHIYELQGAIAWLPLPEPKWAELVDE